MSQIFAQGGLGGRVSPEREKYQPALEKELGKLGSLMDSLRDLVPICTVPSLSRPGECAHEYIPPYEHWDLMHFANSVLQRTDGNLKEIGERLVIDPDTFGWDFVVTNIGEVLVCRTRYFQHVKHPSLAGGQQVWSAGELGVQDGIIRLLSLSSGHYLRGPLRSFSPNDKEALRQYTQTVFETYLNIHGIQTGAQPPPCEWPSETG